MFSHWKNTEHFFQGNRESCRETTQYYVGKKSVNVNWKEAAKVEF